MSDSTESTTTTSEEQLDKEPSSSHSDTTIMHPNTSTPVRLFGQFKGNEFTSCNPSTFTPSISKETSDDKQSTSGTYFTSTLSKISVGSMNGFGSSSSSLTASLASLGANQPLFGESSATKVSSFTDLKSTSAKALDKTNSDSEDDDDDNESETKVSLLETAAEYEAKRATTHPTITNIQGDTSTGEENEVTKFQIVGKLYVYNGEQQQFVERGYGTLKINESRDPSNWEHFQARLIMRLDKSFRVILNSPIFPKMTVERVTDRSIRFGAQDEGQLRVFALKSSTHDSQNLCEELQSRIRMIEQQEPSIQSKQNTSVHNTSVSSDVFSLHDTSSEQNFSTNPTRKRSLSKSDSDLSDSSNDQSKKSKLLEGSQGVLKDEVAQQSVHNQVEEEKETEQGKKRKNSS